MTVQLAVAVAVKCSLMRPLLDVVKVTSVTARDRGDYYDIQNPYITVIQHIKILSAIQDITGRADRNGPTAFSE
jgi:hypothetical protein